MSKREKLRRKLRNNPADATMQEVQTLLGYFGFELARTSGSHYIFEYDDGEKVSQMIVPLHGRKVKKFYVKRISQVLDEMFPGSETDADDSNA